MNYELFFVPLHRILHTCIVSLFSYTLYNKCVHKKTDYD